MINCSKNGVKREGESCSLNNNCIFPNCIKSGKAMFKYNGGALALLCSECKVTIKTGEDFDAFERAACKGRLYHPPQYCTTCIKLTKNEP